MKKGDYKWLQEEKKKLKIRELTLLIHLLLAFPYLLAFCTSARMLSLLKSINSYFLFPQREGSKFYITLFSRFWLKAQKFAPSSRIFQKNKSRAELC